MRWIACLITLLVGCGDDGVQVMADAGPPLDADETLIAPTVTATPGDSQVMVSWTAVPYAKSYRVGRAETPNGMRTMIGTPLAVMLADSGVTNGITYYYAVQAVNARGDGPWSAESSARPVDVLPLAPTGVKATPGRTKATLEWQIANDADDYLVRRANAAGGPYTTVMTASTPPVVDLDVVDNTTYYYVVVARNTGGESVPSTEVNARPTDLIPTVPTNVTVLAGSAETTVMWDAATAASAYLVESAAAQTGPYSFAGVVTGRSLTIRWGSGAWLRVTGISAAGTGDPSQGVQRVALGTELVAPSDVRAQPGSDAVSLRWDSGATATSFVVLRATAQGGPYVPIASPTEKRYTDTGVTAGTYFYVVRTANAPSANSNEVIANVTSSLPALPTGLTVDPNQYRSNVVRWLPVIGASHYVVRARHRLTNDPLTVGHPVSPTFTDHTYYGDPWERYSVSAVVAGIEGPATEEIEVDNAAGPSLSGLTVRAGAERISVVLSPTRAYTVYRAAGANGTSTAMWTGTARQWHDDTAVPGVIYRYRSRTLTPDGVSWSEEVSAQLDAAKRPRPSGLDVTQQGYQWARIDWSPVPGAAGYAIYRASPGGGFTRHGDATDTSFLDHPIQEAPMTYVVTAYDAAGESAASNELTITTPASPPLVAEGVKAEAGDGFVYVSWRFGYAADYRISRATSPGGPYQDLGSYVSDGYDATVSNGVTYYYVVRAIADGVEVVSSEVSATPGSMPAPMLTARAGDRAIALSWSRVHAIWYYKIYRSETAGATTFYTTWNWTQWTDPDVVNGTTYHYRVSAVSTAGETMLSGEVSATPTPGGQSPVVDFQVSSGQDVHIAWFAVPDATSYRVWRAESYNQAFVPIADVSTSPYRDPTPGQHWYVITAVGPDGTSIPTSIAPGWAALHAPPRVRNVTADTTGGKLLVRWDPIGGVAEYEVCWTPQIGAPRPCSITTRTNMALRGWTAGVPLSIWVRIRSTTTQLSPSDEVVATPIAGAPPVPTLFMSTGNGQVSFEWTPVAGATSYRIWRANGADQPMQPYAIVTAAHTVTGLPPGLTPTWAISAINGSYESSWSAELTAGPSQHYPVMPPITASSHAGAIMFDAGLVSDELRWEVARSTEPTWNFVNVPIVTRYRGRFVVAAPSGTATYRIRVCMPLGGCGGDRYVTAATSSTAPSAPAWITVAPGNTELTVTWQPVADATAYRVFRSAGYLQHEAKLEPIAVVSAGHFTDRNLANEMSYVYAVAAISADGESEIADVAWDTLSARYRWAPTNVTATAASTSILVRWDPSPGADAYSVCRATTFDGSPTCTMSASSPYVDTGVTSGSTYYYFVIAQGGSGSNVVAATVP